MALVEIADKEFKHVVVWFNNVTCLVEGADTLKRVAIDVFVSVFHLNAKESPFSIWKIDKRQGGVEEKLAALSLFELGLVLHKQVGKRQGPVLLVDGRDDADVLSKCHPVHASEFDVRSVLSFLVGVD